jgi:hypothetical protein
MTILKRKTNTHQHFGHSASNDGQNVTTLHTRGEWAKASKAPSFNTLAPVIALSQRRCGVPTGPQGNPAA